jgi:hypothetical protein
MSHDEDPQCPVPSTRDQHFHPVNEMSAGEDDDVKLQRASASLIADFTSLLPHLLRKRKHGLVKTRLMYQACSLVRLLCVKAPQY